MTPRVLFNCVPPALIAMPAPAFSVLKGFLEARQINCSLLLEFAAGSVAERIFMG